LEGLLDFWQSLDGGAVLGLMVLFSGKSQIEVRCSQV